MPVFRLLVGFVLFLLGWGYFFYPQLILRLNAFARERLFKDSVVILSHRRIGVTLLLIAIIFMVLTLHGPH